MTHDQIAADEKKQNDAFRTWIFTQFSNMTTKQQLDLIDYVYAIHCENADLKATIQRHEDKQD